MQVFGNIATEPERKVSKTTERGYYTFRLAESQRGVDNVPTFYTVRVMKDEVLDFKKGDFVRCTGKLKVDFYLSREGKPTGTLLIIAFESTKIAKPDRAEAQVKKEEQEAPAKLSAVPTKARETVVEETREPEQVSSRRY
jgi:hypothetical protein